MMRSLYRVSEDSEMRHLAPLDFELPPGLEAHEPPEARGLPRDGVRLMVSRVSDDRVEHARFSELGGFLSAGDVLVINTSATVNAALDARRESGESLFLHLSTRLPGGLWIVEPRTPSPDPGPFRGASPGERLRLPAGAAAVLHAPYSRKGDTGRGRLWLASLEEIKLPIEEYLERYGVPVRYGHVPDEWPISYYQTVYATEPGSAEMPSAGRAFTPELVTSLVARGVQFAPLVLHTGVSSSEADEPPYEEYYRVPPETARLVNAARERGRERGKRIVAVGTTAVRALESAADEEGVVHPAEGWAELVITPEGGVRAVDALLTGLHEPRSSHLSMLEALADRRRLHAAYAEALRQRYLWHEFGDLHLILP